MVTQKQPPANLMGAALQKREKRFSHFLGSVSAGCGSW
jgi:hypothetical protein